MEFAIIDYNQAPMAPGRGRGAGFSQALPDWELGKDYEFVRYDRIMSRMPDLMGCRGLILSGSAFDFARPDGSFDREVYEWMSSGFRLMLDFRSPILGICFGHQLMALAEEFDPGRNEFGRLQVQNMRYPRDRHTVLPIHTDFALHFTSRQDFFGQFHHKQEVVLNDALLEYFEITARSNQCPVQVMQHRTREWFGIQFHPETGVKSEAGETDRHDEALRDGQMMLRDFVRYCLGRDLLSEGRPQGRGSVR